MKERIEHVLREINVKKMLKSGIRPASFANVLVHPHPKGFTVYLDKGYGPGVMCQMAQFEVTLEQANLSPKKLVAFIHGQVNKYLKELDELGPPPPEKRSLLQQAEEATA